MEAIKPRVTEKKNSLNSGMIQYQKQRLESSDYQNCQRKMTIDDFLIEWYTRIVDLPKETLMEEIKT